MSKSSKTERLKAIRKAWEREQGLVAEGKGTRDWTKEQQEDILDPAKGKAYDENGRAFEGQHMKSAAEYPEYQGDPDNIQFLTKEEHLEAHKGSWQNSTNWYYNPETKEFVDFGENKPIPCEVINLSEPVSIAAEVLQDELKSGKATSDQQVKKTDADVGAKTEHSKSTSNSTKSNPTKHARNSSTQTSLPPKTPAKSSGGILSAIKGFAARHPVLTSLGITAAATAGKIAIDALTGNGGSGTSGGGSSDYSPSSDSQVDYDNAYDDNGYDDSTDSRDYPDERSSPREHIVPGHGQHYHTKDGVIWKEKDPYPRGGKHDDDD